MPHPEVRLGGLLRVLGGGCQPAKERHVSTRSDGLSAGTSAAGSVSSGPTPCFPPFHLFFYNRQIFSVFRVHVIKSHPVLHGGESSHFHFLLVERYIRLI